MRSLRDYLDSMQPLFDKGGRFEKFSALYEIFDSLLYTPGIVTRGAPHVRDGIDLKRLMIMVVFAATPVALFCMWNTGFQANAAMAEMGIEAAAGWRGYVLDLFAIGYDPDSIWACFWHGLLYFLPIYIVTLAAGGFWEVLFAAVRGHDVNEGFLVTSLLFALIVPPTIPLWQVAMGMSFGVVIGKEGVVVGDVATQDAIVAGRVNGSVSAESRVELQASCRVEGDIRSRRIKLDEGGQVDGQLHMGGQSSGQRPESSKHGENAAKSTAGAVQVN